MCNLCVLLCCVFVYLFAFYSAHLANKRVYKISKRYRPHGGDMIPADAHFGPFRSISVISRHRRPQQMTAAIQCFYVGVLVVSSLSVKHLIYWSCVRHITHFRYIYGRPA